MPHLFHAGIALLLGGHLSRKATSLLCCLGIVRGRWGEQFFALRRLRRRDWRGVRRVTERLLQAGHDERSRLAGRTVRAPFAVLGDFQQTVTHQLAIRRRVRELSRTTRGNLSVIQRSDQFGSDGDHHFGFGVFVAFAAERGSDIRQFAEKRHLV